MNNTFIIGKYKNFTFDQVYQINDIKYNKFLENNLNHFMNNNKKYNCIKSYLEYIYSKKNKNKNNITNILKPIKINKSINNLPNPSNEQINIIKKIQFSNIIVDSVAGSGKTTTNLYISQQYQNKNILLLTYNKRLRLETQEKAKLLGIKNMEIHTYHSFSVKYYDKKCYNDYGIIKIINSNNKPNLNYSYDILIIDEAQDINPYYYELICKIINFCDNPKICVIGDVYQSIYKYNNSDERFILNANSIFNFNNFKWNNLNLSYSFRITNQMSDFINYCLLNGNERIKSNKNGDPVKYIICDSFGIKPYIEITKFIKNGYNYDDIFILAPSIKQKQTNLYSNPITKLANLLSDKNIPIHVPCSDDVKLDKQILEGKLVFSTFHQVKGLERKVVIVFNFDNSYFEFYNKFCDFNKCPNELYVATTRSQEQLVLLHHYQNNFLPFINKKNLKKYCDFQDNELYLKDKSKKISEHTISTGITDIVKHLPVDIISKSLEYFDVLKINKKDKTIKIPIKTKQNDLYEDVSDINGIAIPLCFEFINTGSITVFDNMKEKLNIKDYNLDSMKPSELLEISNIWNSYKNGYKFKMVQIKKYDWLKKKNLMKCIEKLKNHISENATFEVKCSVFDINTTCNRKLIGYFDCIDNNNLWEFKCVKELTNEHLLQLAFYMYMNETTNKNNTKNYNYYLFNILNGERLQIKSDLNRLSKMVKFIIDYKYNNNCLQSSKDFITYIKPIYNKYKKNKINKKNKFMVLDIETDGAKTGHQIIIQIAYNIYDFNFNIIEKKNYLINDDGNNVDFYNKISLENIKYYGKHPKFVLKTLSDDLNKCEYIIGHNINFDINHICKYFYNYKINYTLPNIVDTMLLSKNILNLKNKNNNIKNPTLKELYYFISNKIMEDNSSHTADYDVDITADCFRYLVNKNFFVL